ncbi:S-adenosyl-L-methionine-dependent methyltransferase [Bimuria novae-zelandiae CBS 107.79]|uniref:S-adenosyl-L-methionine-dependent methyltransferase n=1 Tax=Bimuria novae-zelandiae CBS 107.79 TaxID=1447943 RepID=A0A6A5VR50_9PLEO|nr:S-adenosyl-L-methionine-dependent methyltransferase [Bimuria novae-zelandiae CBS 107.79]
MSTPGSATASGGTAAEVQSTQNKQYDKIGSKYGDIKEKPATQPERPSVVAVLGDITGKRCLDLACGLGHYTALLASLGASSVHGYDISPKMVEAARSTYPPSQYPNLHFDVADCSDSDNLPSSEPFDIVFAGWFLNYAGTEKELTNMFRVIVGRLREGGRFVGVTTDAHDLSMKEPKRNFYGVDVEVLEKEYVAPDTGREVGIKARVTVQTEPPFCFEVFQFRSEVYERCAKEAGMQIAWKKQVLPDDERKESGYWDEWVQRPTFSVIEATVE